MPQNGSGKGLPYEGLTAAYVPRWNADLVLYRLQPLSPLQHPLLAGQWFLHRAPPRPAAGVQHQVRGEVVRPSGEAFYCGSLTAFPSRLQAGAQGRQHPAVEGLDTGGAESHPAQHQLLLCVR